jgi:hypothetical protein
MNEAAPWGGFFLPHVFFARRGNKEAACAEVGKSHHSVAYAPEALYLRAYGQEVSSFP